MIQIKTLQEIQAMREGGKILKQIIDQLVAALRPGMTTKELDMLARELVKESGTKPAFLGYGGFPATVCLSVNDEVVHGVPSDRILEDGDIIGIDMGVIYQGWNLDSAVTVPVLGDMSYQDWAATHPQENRLIEVTKEALALGIKEVRIGANVGAISAAIQKTIEKAGFGVVRDLVGHGIGKKLHEEPHVPNFGKQSEGPILQEGMVIAIEPIVTIGDWQLKIGDDGYTYLTKDGSKSAHFEHTVAITKDGPEILTK